MPYTVQNLIQCIADSFNVNMEFQQTQGFYELMGDVFKGMSTLDSIQEAMERMDKILGREKKYIMLNGKKEVWPMGNNEEVFKAIGRTIQLHKNLGKLGPILKNKIANQSNLCTMEPAIFLQEMIKIAEEINKFEPFSTAYKEPAEKTEPKKEDEKSKKKEDKPETTT